jgi:hypothetical protein
MSMGYVDKLIETNITCMEEICRNKKNNVIATCTDYIFDRSVE